MCELTNESYASRDFAAHWPGWMIVWMALCLLSASVSADPGRWTQWGGDGRDFGSTLDAETNVVTWDALGPKVLWLQPIEPGYSAIVSDGARLFTMARDGDLEAMLALSPKDGKTLWRSDYPAPTGDLRGVDMSYGDGPQATPLVADGHVVGLGFTAILSAVEAESGTLRWRTDLRAEHEVGMLYFGHAASPVRVGDTVVVAAGGAHAFDLETGEPRWHNREFGASYASPILVESPAGRRLVIAGEGELVGLDPKTGELLWRHEHANPYRTFLSTPVSDGDGMVFASAYDLGSVALRIKADGVEKAWQLEDLQISQSNAVRSGRMLVASHRRTLVAVDLPTGEVLWRQKGVRRSNLVRQGENTLLLDDRGNLTVASMDRGGFRVQSRAQILEGRSWTPPTVIGDRLYARNGTSVVAVQWTESAQSPTQTLAGLKGTTAPSMDKAPGPVLELIEAVMAATLASDGATLAELHSQWDRWIESESAVVAHYYRGFIAWQLSSIAPQAERLSWLDRGVEDLKLAIGLKEDFADAHALLGSLYPAYWRLDRGRAMAIGPLGDEHLIRALELEPENPRVLGIQGLDLIHSPAQYGGDPEQGMEVLANASHRIAAERARPGSPAPAWGKALIPLWLAQQTAQRGEATKALEILGHVLEQAPGFTAARQLQQSLSSP